MSFRTWFANLQVARTFDRLKQDWRRSPRRRHTSWSSLPAEVLEVRSLLSSYAAASVSALVADINAANANGGTNTIMLAANTKFDLTAVNNTTNGANGLPVISGKNGADNLTIIGSGATIDRSTAAGTPAFRLFNVANRNSLTLENLTLQGGLAKGSGTAADGGAVFNRGALTLSGVTVQNNVAAGMDGASYVGGKIGSTLAAAADAAGGGVWSNGTLTLQDQTLPGGGSIHTLLQNNTAQGGNGGIYWFSNTYLIGWTAANGGNALGGGLYIAGGTANLANANLANNVARGGAGAGTNQVETLWGGLGGAGFGGAVDIAGGTVAMTGLVLQSNQALGGAGGWGDSTLNGTHPGNGGAGSGGGINVAGGTLTLATVDLLSNTVQSGQSGALYGMDYLPDGVSGSASGAGLCVGGGAVTLTHDMVTGNRAIAAYAGGRYYGGGIDIASAATIYVDSSTVANTINNYGYLNGIILPVGRRISNIYGAYVLRN
jgi:hypothetical protein